MTRPRPVPILQNGLLRLLLLCKIGTSHLSSSSSSYDAARTSPLLVHDARYSISKSYMRKIGKQLQGRCGRRNLGSWALGTLHHWLHYYRPSTFDSSFLCHGHIFQTRTAKIAPHPHAVEILSDPCEPQNCIPARYLHVSTITSAKRCVVSSILAALLSSDVKH
jgi:hypothetical protein